MNNLLQLKGRFEKRKNESGFGLVKLPANQSVTVSHIENLIKELERVKKYWTKNTDIAGVLISVHYIRIIAKSNRLRVLLGDTGKNPTDSIRGAKFVVEENEENIPIQKHVFTHYVQMSAIDLAIENLRAASDIVRDDFQSKITADDTEKLGGEIPYTHKDIMSKSCFLNVIVDCYFVEKFDIDVSDELPGEDSIVTIYRTDIDTRRLLSKFGIDVLESKIIDGTTLLLSPDQIQLLHDKAPYLIAMSVTDFTKIDLDSIAAGNQIKDYEDTVLPSPQNEPIIGVIDTHFNEKVYFHEWVEYKNMLPDEIALEERDYYHGTAVSSIIVDGSKGNPKLDDGCGRFRVRHFGVSTQNGFSSFAVLRNIRNIVSTNPDIKVWNLSLGSPNQIKDNFISPEGAELDRIQSEYDVIFVVAGTNIPAGVTNREMKVGAPADSLNSIVVNSVNMQGKPASYTRKGPVLSFFHKPDISYYGGDGNKAEEKIAVCIDELGAVFRTGTSFAAPWITRKVAYLIHMMGLSREVAKALIIDSAASWSASGEVSDKLGYGVVPKHIKDILNTSDDEIKFVIMGTAEDYETYNYNLPVPVVEGKHPFFARAVLAYFPSCDRNQGVDYTGTEMDIHFGRVYSNRKRAVIKTIDDNKQSEEGQYIYEKNARSIYRKWDNIKRICEQVKKRAVPRKSYESGMWGLGILTKERVVSKEKKPLPFGVVITLKEMNGRNRIDDFIKLCMAHGWLVNRLDIQNQLEIYTQAEEEIELE